MIAIAPMLLLGLVGMAVPILIGVVGIAAARPFLRAAPVLLPVLLPVIFAVSIGGVLLFDRPRVIERCGLRCRGCGYDLQGQVEPRCPECARELDADERAALAACVPSTTPVDHPGLRKWTIVLVSVLILIVLVQLVMVFWGARRYAARRAQRMQPTTSQAVTPALPPMTTSGPSGN
jgi:hypothetical protein